jgi:hypothetical protein
MQMVSAGAADGEQVRNFRTAHAKQSWGETVSRGEAGEFDVAQGFRPTQSIHVQSPVTEF